MYSPFLKVEDKTSGMYFKIRILKLIYKRLP